MEIRIGVTYTPKEIMIELADGADGASVKASVDSVLSGSDAVLWLEDKKGRQVGVPADKIAYVEVGSEDSTRPIGFG
ncbi:MAG: DUF3107 domain-containing protein [Acidimicrobiia bacterium]|nr:DUF3107 domain-containing protein [Acidimicrobiia bacterium]